MRALLFFFLFALYSPVLPAMEIFSEVSEIYVAQDSVVAPERVNYDKDTNLDRPEFDPENIESYKNDSAFDYLAEVEQDSWWTKFKKWLQLHYQNFISWLFGDYKANVIIAFLLQILPYLIVAAIIGLIFYLFIRLNPGPSIIGNSPAPEVFYNEEEKIVRSQNIPELIKAAIEKRDYRLAVRYYYLQLLKQLQEKGLINYEFQKTNAEYLREIREEKIQLPLKKVMRIYDFIWYGSFAVSETDFLLAQRYFGEIERSLEKIPNEK